MRCRVQINDKEVISGLGILCTLVNLIAFTIPITLDSSWVVHFGALWNKWGGGFGLVFSKSYPEHPATPQPAVLWKCKVPLCLWEHWRQDYSSILKYVAFRNPGFWTYLHLSSFGCFSPVLPYSVLNPFFDVLAFTCSCADDLRLANNTLPVYASVLSNK